MAALLNNRAWWILAVLALLAGTAWRASHLESRPLHADEAVQAWQTWNLLNGEGYRYDPFDKHGPSLYYGAAWLHQIRGGGAASFGDRDARRFSLAAGVATLALFAFGTSSIGLGRATGAVAAALLAFETFSSVYHTYFVQEASLAFLVWAFVFLLCGQSGKSIDRKRLLALGIIAGLAQATKGTAPLYLAMAVGAWWFAQRREERLARPDLRQVGLFFLGAAIPYVLLQSSFGQNPRGVWDGIYHYVLQVGRLQDNPHEYPWSQIGRYLGIVPTGGPNWGQYLLLTGGLLGFGLGLHRSSAPAHRTISLLTGALLLFHTLISYKTPWLLLTPMIGLTLLAAIALVRVGQISRWGSAIAAVLLLLTCGQSLAKSKLTLERYPGDERNPYFYVQTPRPFARLPDRIVDLIEANQRDLSIAVVSGEHAWPLPWYLRDVPTVGFHATPPDNLAVWDMVIWDSQLGDAPLELGNGTVFEFYGLRPGVLLHCFIREPVWEELFPPLPETPSP